MKRLTMLFLILLSTTSLAQYHSGAVKLGYFNPKATDGGFIIGYEGGHAIDRNLIIGWSIDWFHKNYTDQTLVSEFNQFDPNIGGELNELRAKTNLHGIPIMFNLSAFNLMKPSASFCS